MAGRIEQLTGVTVDTGVKLYRDKSINKGTRAIFDMSSQWSGGKASNAAGAVIKSLSYENSTGVLSLAHEYANGGMTWAGVKSDQFQLPSQFVPALSDKHWLFTVWLKITNGGVSGSNNQTLNIGPAYNSLFTYLRLLPTCDASGAATTIEVRCLSKNYVVTSALMPLYNGDVHQFAVECQVSEDGTQQKVIMWLDKVSVYDSGFQATANTMPSDSSQRYIGTSTSLTRSFAGSFYRTRFDDLVASGLSASSVLTADYSSSRTRFS